MTDNERADFVQDLRTVAEGEAFATVRSELIALHDKYRAEPFLFAHLLGITSTMGGLVGALEREPVRVEAVPTDEPE